MMGRRIHLWGQRFREDERKGQAVPSRQKGKPMGSGLRLLLFFTLLLFPFVNSGKSVWAQPVEPGTVPIEENISITRHNLSTTGLGTTKSNTKADVCVFCHTPHGASPTGTTLKAPLWNRNLDYSTNTAYVLYDQAWSFSFEGTLNDPTKPTGYSRLCLSCHDGAIALGSVINKPGSGGFQGYLGTTDVMSVQNTGPSGTMPPGLGALTGDTRLLGPNLQNDHPISFRFDSDLVSRDAELVNPGSPPSGLNDATPLAPAGAYKTGVKLYGTTAAPNTFDSVQCTSCHNPHAVTYPKFLRAPRFQDASESGFLPGGGGGPTPATGQIICLYCHAKPGWNESTHDVSLAVRAAYPSSSNPYDFDGGHTVGSYACRNCHDPHTAQGAKRLHREGVSAFGVSDAIENTCYLCHSPNATPLTTTFLPATDPTTGGNPRFLSNGQRIAPDIYSEFAKDQSACLGGSGPGSAMCLQLSTGHEPVFISRSQEGIQVKSEGLALKPIVNEDTPGISTLDVAHVECVDCHNPHQVNSPNFFSLAYNKVPNPGPLSGGSPDARGEGGRFKGMKGIGIDASGTRPIVIGRCEPGFVICGTEATINANHPLLAPQSSANRDPYVYEICFRCHGNSYTNIWGPNNSGKQFRYPDDLSTLVIPPNYASMTAIRFSPRSDPSNGWTGDQFSFKGFSNKWLEFNPFTPDLDTEKLQTVDRFRFGTTVASKTQQTMNPAYHPVVLPGRNGSWQLCNQLSIALELNCGSGVGVVVNTPGNPTAAAAALKNHTIQCVDCHNSNLYDTFGNSYPNSYTAGLDGGPLSGHLTESNLRPTDVWPNLNIASGYNYVTDRPSKPIGPHGSTHKRLLRADYDTDILRPGRCFEQGNPSVICGNGDGYSSGAAHSIAGGGQGSNDGHFRQFLLCFNCHDRRAFDPDVAASGGSSDQDRKWTRFFGVANSSAVDSWWNGNLHMYHLRWTGAMCHECHYNVHSNIESLNTIFGDGRGGDLPTDDVDGITDGVIGTHLINFGPLVEGTTDLKPRWFFDGSAFRCYMRCHNEVMDSCAYQANSTGTPNARWCAGGRNPGTSG